MRILTTILIIIVLIFIQLQLSTINETLSIINETNGYQNGTLEKYKTIQSIQLSNMKKLIDLLKSTGIFKEVN